MDADRLWFLGAMLAGLAVILGAFGAHGLEGRVADPALLETWSTAAHYHLAHALGLMLIAAHPRRPRLAARLLVAGIVLFSGSLYLLVLTNTPVLGAITPLGGLCFIGGWAALAWSSRPGRPGWER